MGGARLGTETEERTFPTHRARDGAVLLSSQGLHWVITRENGENISQKQYPHLVLVTVSCHGDSIHLDAPGKGTLKLSSKQPVDKKKQIRTIRIMLQDVAGVDCGDVAAAWINGYLDTEGLRIAYSAPGLQKKEFSLLKQTGSTQRYPGIPNFRPNIVIDGPPPFQEDNWQEVRIGKVYFRCLFSLHKVSPHMRLQEKNPRCPITTVDPDTGVRDEHQQPLQTLMKFRRLPEYGFRPSFGCNLALDNQGDVRVGDPVYVLME
ncbi:hypothetical protein ScPMuIL_017087 [Solemya velum]